MPKTHSEKRKPRAIKILDIQFSKVYKALLYLKVPLELLDMQNQINATKAAKNEAVRTMHYEKAADLRYDETTLMSKQEKMQTDFLANFESQKVEIMDKALLSTNFNELWQQYHLAEADVKQAIQDKAYDSVKFFNDDLLDVEDRIYTKLKYEYHTHIRQNLIEKLNSNFVDFVKLSIKVFKPQKIKALLKIMLDYYIAEITNTEKEAISSFDNETMLFKNIIEWMNIPDVVVLTMIKPILS